VPLRPGLSHPPRPRTRNALSDDPTDDEVEAALAGADVEVLVFSEPASSETGDL